MKEITINHMDTIKQSLNISSDWIYEYSTLIQGNEIQVYYHKTNNEALIVNKSRNQLINLTEDDILVLGGMLRFYQDKFNSRNKQDVQKYKSTGIKIND